uniref:G-protein coupled receptors family 2 profile 2 domain-containing protein n=1 Tax=Biomphalaria glabrata TaxID=6526 RepID=A0A2C9LWY4_BIOGL
MCLDNLVSLDQRSLYQMLVNIRSQGQDSDSNYGLSNCSDTNWEALNGECLELRCSPGKTLKAGTCTSIFQDIKGLVYRVRALLVFTDNDCASKYLTNSILLDLAELQIKQDISTRSDGYIYEVGVAQEWNRTVTDRATPVLWADIYVLASRLLTRDSFENIALDIFFGSRYKLGGNTFVYYNLLTEAISSFTNKSGLKRGNIGVDKAYIDFLILGLKHSLTVSSTLTCSFLTFQQTNFTVQWNKFNEVENILVTLDVGGTKLNISNMSDFNSMEVTRNNELHVCAKILDKYVKKSRESRNVNRPMNEALNILTYACMGASELCLLLTLVTYLAFPELRTVPGINNMFLSLSLLLAQLALILASNSYGPSTLCTCIGIVTHFLWLWHFTWSFLCSLHMFRVFTAKIPSHVTKDDNFWLRLLKLTSVSLLGPVLIVTAVVVYSYVTSKTIGYGQYLCYLDSSSSIGVSVVAPVCLVSFCNLIFLAITIASIHQVNALLTFVSVKIDQYHNLVLYVKLSSVTGAFWIVTIVAEVGDIDVLRILAILFNGLQGVSIFISYICNPRVYHLYFKRSPQQTSSAPPTTETLD